MQTRVIDDWAILVPFAHTVLNRIKNNTQVLSSACCVRDIVRQLMESMYYGQTVWIVNLSFGPRIDLGFNFISISFLKYPHVLSDCRIYCEPQ